ncbi:hypothetical protein [Umezawaea tangerina]|uniref:Uncharacterized protein n=1 Tax=Umezawaea tangerina TaxID=84725 RepID=A0A2T0SS92_9PSEU|nr:hypothetical protein [Umezawaea tangerina]PRY36279.1 hypothetical protein CLV43_112206 [Umezawaea tangerina]
MDNHLTALAHAATVAARLLQDHPDLPRVVGINLRPLLVSDDVEVEIALQLSPDSDLTGVATAVTNWARTLDCTVSFSVADTFTQIAAQTRIDGHAMQVWNHLTPADTATVFTGLGLPAPTRGTHVEISPSALLRTITTTPAAVA